MRGVLPSPVVERWKLIMISLDYIFWHVHQAKTKLAIALSRPGVATRAMKIERLDKTVPPALPGPSKAQVTRPRKATTCQHVDDDMRPSTVINAGGWGRSLTCKLCDSRWLSVNTLPHSEKMTWIWWPRTMIAANLRAQYLKDPPTSGVGRVRYPEGALPPSSSQSQPSSATTAAPKAKAQDKSTPTPLWKIAAGLNRRVDLPTHTLPGALISPVEMANLSAQPQAAPNNPWAQALNGVQQIPADQLQQMLVLFAQQEEMNRFSARAQEEAAALLSSTGWGRAASGGWIPPNATPVGVAPPPPPLEALPQTNGLSSTDLRHGHRGPDGRRLERARGRGSSVSFKNGYQKRMIGDIRKAAEAAQFELDVCQAALDAESRVPAGCDIFEARTYHLRLRASRSS